MQNFFGQNYDAALLIIQRLYDAPTIVLMENGYKGWVAREADLNGWIGNEARKRFSPANMSYFPSEATNDWIRKISNNQSSLQQIVEHMEGMASEIDTAQIEVSLVNNKVRVVAPNENELFQGLVALSMETMEEQSLPVSICRQ